MTTVEILSEKIAELTLENAEMLSDMQGLLEQLDKLTIIIEILNQYLKGEKYLITAIIDGEDAKILADFFGIPLEEIKE
jgi:hypothetical protein